MRQQQAMQEGPPIIVVLIALLIVAFMIASMWKIFTKAGEPGWAAIVPIYNVLVLAKISGKDWWWGLLTFIPCVGTVISIIMTVGMARNFGKDIGYAIGIILLPFIFLPMLAFGGATFTGTKGAWF